MEYKKILIPAVFLSVIILNSNHALAQAVNKQEVKEKRMEEKQELKVMKEEKKEEMAQTKAAKRLATCTEVSSKIVNRKTQLEKSVTNYQASIAKIDTLISKRIQELKTAGKNTAEIEANYAKFKSDAQSIVAQRQTLLSKLQNIDTTNCQTDKNAFATNVKSFNATLKTIVESQNNLKKYLRDNVVAKIKSLKEVSNE